MVSRVHKKHGSKEVLPDDESPICTFPPEVLSAIFAAGTEIEETSTTDSNPLSGETGLSFELLVSHVCSYFRDIAIGTPSLWTGIFIAPTTKPEKLLTYIARSLGCGLDLRVDMSGWASSALGRYAMMEMINFVSAQSHRWRRLSIAAAGESEDNSIVMILCSRNAPALEYLSICVDNVEHVDEGVVRKNACEPRIFSQGAPRLSFVRLRGLAIYLFRPPLQELTTLHLDQTKALPMRFSMFRDIVTLSPALAHLSLYGDIIGNEPWSGRALIILPALRSLRICGISGRVYGGALQAIDAPQLESLVLKDLHEHDLDGLWDDAEAVARYCHLKHLTFCDFEVSDFAYKRLLRAFPDITEFSSFHSSIGTSPISPILAAASDVESDCVTERPWPFLHTLAFLFDDDEDEDWIKNVVTRRKETGRPLVKLRFGTNYAGVFKRWKNNAALENALEIETFSDIDRWPANRSYPDQDDGLFP